MVEFTRDELVTLATCLRARVARHEAGLHEPWYKMVNDEAQESYIAKLRAMADKIDREMPHGC